MTNEHDERLGAALRNLTTPEAGSSFWDEFRSSVASAHAIERTTSLDTEGNMAMAPTPIDISETKNHRPRGSWILAAAAAILVLAMVGFTLTRTSDDSTADLASGGDDVDVDAPAAATTEPVASSSATAAATASARPAGEALEVDSLTYPSIHGPTGSISLVGGRWQGEPAAGGSTVTTSQLVLVQDAQLDEDSIDDAVVVLATDPGGSGTFYDLYVVDGVSQVVAGPAYLGDRIDDLSVTITDRLIDVTFAERDGPEQVRQYGLVDGELRRLDAPFPLAGAFGDSGCHIAGESTATIDYLDDTATLVACLDAEVAPFVDTYGAYLLDVVDGYALFSIPNSAVSNTTMLEVRFGTGEPIFIEGTCLIEEDNLTVEARELNEVDGATLRSLDVTATVTDSVGTFTYGDIDATLSGEVTQVTTGSDGFEVIATSATGVQVVVNGGCFFAAPDSELFDAGAASDPDSIEAAIGEKGLSRSAVVDLNYDGLPDVIALMSGPEWCGSGGCTAFVLEGTPDGGLALASRMTLVDGDIRVGPLVDDGWSDLYVQINGGDFALLRHDGATYPLNPSVQPTGDAADALELFWVEHS